MPMTFKSKFMAFSEAMTWKLHPKVYSGLFPIINRKLNWPLTIRYHSNKQLLISDLDGHLAIFNSRPIRLRRYRNGVKSLLFGLSSSYGIHKVFQSLGHSNVDVNRRLIAIDVGANVGEFSLALNKLFNFRGDIYAFEPDPREFASLSENANIAGNITPICSALSDKNGKSPLALQNDSGDSTLLTTQRQKTIEVDTVTLDYFLDEQDCESRIFLLKIEAEGLEPEVLMGALSSLRRCYWVTADLGPERYGRSTRSECENILVEMGFVLEYRNELGNRFLFKNSNL